MTGLGFIGIPVSLEGAIFSLVVEVPATVYTTKKELGQVKKHGRTMSQIESDFQQKELARKALALALKGKLLKTKYRISILEELGMKKVFGLGGVVAVGLVALSLFLLYGVRRATAN